MQNWYNKIINYELICINDELYYIFEKLKDNKGKTWYIEIHRRDSTLKDWYYYYNYKTYYKAYMKIYWYMWVRGLWIIKEITRKWLNHYIYK